MNKTSSISAYHLIDCYVSILFLFTMLVNGSMIGEVGLGWHLRTGEWITNNKTIPIYDIFSFSTDSIKWVSNQWLSDVIFWIVYTLGGFSLLHIISCLICIATPATLLIYHQSNNKINIFLNISILIFVVCLLKLQWFTRPVIISFLLFSIVNLVILSKERLNMKRRVVLVLLFTAWSNLHPAFSIALMALLIRAFVETCMSKFKCYSYFIVFFMSCGATLINPYSYNLHLEIIKLLRSSYFMRLNSEWLPPDNSEIFFPYYICSVLTILSIPITMQCLKKSKNIEVEMSQLLLTIILLIASVFSRRYIPFFSISIYTYFIILGEKSNLNKMLVAICNKFLSKDPTKCKLYKLPVFITALLCSLTFTILKGRIPFHSHSYTELNNKEFMKCLYRIEGNQNIKILNHPDLGGKLIYHFYPKRAVFIDDRNELHGEEKYKILLEPYDLPKDIDFFLKENNFTHVIFPNNSHFFGTIIKDKTTYDITACGQGIELLEIKKDLS